MSTYTLILNLPVVLDLHSEKAKELRRLIGELQLNDVKDDGKFQATTKRVKASVLLSPVVFADPKITGHIVNIVQVDFPFTGSEELFEYAPNGGNYGGSMAVYQPEGRTVPVEVEMHTLDKATALTEARKKMEQTVSMMQQHSQPVQDWSRGMEPQIDAALQKKREELIALYS